MSSSNISSVTFTESGHAVEGRTRVIGVYFTNNDTASTFTLVNGVDNTGPSLLTINTPAAAGASDIIIPDMGILFDTGVYIEFGSGDVGSVTVLFYGGAAV